MKRRQERRQNQDKCDRRTTMQQASSLVCFGSHSLGILGKIPAIIAEEMTSFGFRGDPTQDGTQDRTIRLQLHHTRTNDMKRPFGGKKRRNVRCEPSGRDCSSLPIRAYPKPATVHPSLYASIQTNKQRKVMSYVGHSILVPFVHFVYSHVSFLENIPIGYPPVLRSL